MYEKREEIKIALKSKRGLLTVLIGSFLVGTSLYIYQPIWPFLVEEAGVNASTYGLIVSGANVLEFVVRWIFASFSSPALTFLLGSIGIAASSGIILMNISPLIIFASLALARMGRALHIMGRNQVTSLLLKEKAGTVFSSVRVSWQIGAILGPALGVALISIATRNMALSFGLLFGLLATFMIAPLIGEFGVKGKGRITFWKGSLTSETRGIVGLTFLNNFARNSFFPFHLVLAPAIFGARVEHIALAAMLEGATSIFFSIPIGWLSDKIRDKRVILGLSEVFMVLGILVYIMPSAGIPGFLAAAVLLGLGSASYAPIVTAVVSKLAPRNPQDAIAFLSTAISLSRLPAPIVTGALIAAFSYSVAFTFSSLCLLIVGVTMFVSSMKAVGKFIQ